MINIKRQVDRNAFRVVLYHILQVFAAFLKIKILTTMLSADSFAKYAVFMSLTAVSIALSTGGIDFLLTKKISDIQKRGNFCIERIQKLIYVVSLIILFALILQLFIIIGSTSKIDIINTTACLLIVALSSLNAVILAILKGFNLLVDFSRSYLFGSLTNSLIQCIFVFFINHEYVILLILSATFFQLICNVMLFITNKRTLDYRNLLPTKTAPLAYVKVAIYLGSAKAYTAGISMLSQFALIMFLSKYISASHVAKYYLYNTLLMQAANIVLIAIGSVYFRKLLELSSKSKKQLFLNEVFRQTALISFWLAFIYFILVLTFKFYIGLISDKHLFYDPTLFAAMACASFLASIKQSFDLSLYCHAKPIYFLSFTTLGAFSLTIVPIAFVLLWGIDGFGIGLVLHGIILGLVSPIFASHVYKFSLFRKEFGLYLISAIIFVTWIIIRGL